MKTRSSYTMSELVYAIVIVCVSALGLAYAILQFQVSQSASATILNVVALEAALSQDLVDPKNYSDESTKMALRSLRLPPSLVFKFTAHVALAPNGAKADVPITIKPNETLMLDRAFQPCKTYPIGDCGYKIKLTLDQHSASFAFEVASAFPEAAMSLERSGRAEVVIPKSAYRDPERIACDPRREVGFTSLESADKFECLSKPQALCHRGTLPKALIVNAETHSLELKCGEPSRVVRCPAYYSLARVNTKSLDGREKIEATCVRITESISMPKIQPEPAVRMSGRVCPQGYHSDSACSLVNVKARPGKCGSSGVAQPVAGKLHFTQSKNTVDCGVEIQSQTCGAVWQGLAQLKIRCVLDEPEFANAL